MNLSPHTRVLIHAPTRASVTRARNNAANLRKLEPETEVVILVNADGVEGLLDVPREDTDGITLVCENTLNRIGKSAPAPLRTVPSSVVALARMQKEGWLYLRA